jgi:hypothetical protein
MHLIRKYWLYNKPLYRSNAAVALDLANQAFRVAKNAQGSWLTAILYMFAFKIRTKHLVNGKRTKSKTLQAMVDMEHEIVESMTALHEFLEEAKTYDGHQQIISIPVEKS